MVHGRVSIRVGRTNQRVCAQGQGEDADLSIVSVILTQRPLAVGLETAAGAIRKAQERLATAAAEVARQGAAPSVAPGAKVTTSAGLPAQTPPNPGPPGGAHPADLAQAIVDERLSVHDLTANVKTVQAFDQMLEELSRLGRSATEPPRS